MSMNYDDPSRPTPSPTDEEGLLFAPVPAWERGRKRKGFGAAPRPAEPRSYQTAGGTIYADTDGDGVAGPVGRTRTTATTTRRSGVPAAAVAAGVVALAGLGAAGWYASRDNDRVAELTPGVAETAPVLPPTDTATPAPAATQMAAAEPARTPAMAARTTTTQRAVVTRTASATRTRAPRTTSAADTGVNASAKLPEGPQPYSSTTTTTTSTVAPSTESTPAPIPSTPPISAAPAPVNPATPDPTPPQEPKVEPPPM